jgi:hypothetical protein
MRTRNISLTPEQDAFIEEAVKSGEYQNAGARMRSNSRPCESRLMAGLMHSIAANSPRSPMPISTRISTD